MAHKNIQTDRKTITYNDGLVLDVLISADLNHPMIHRMARRAASSPRKRSAIGAGALKVQVLNVISVAGSNEGSHA